MNKRDLPWRRTKDPYFIWLSEIILQQTRVAQGLKYYEKFTSEFPDIIALSRADEKKVMKLWQGLGYYSRARNMHFTSKVIAEQHGGEFPKSFKKILSLKGVGDYTASAISSISFNQPQAVVDGNVYRVLSRYFGLSDPIDSTTGKKKFKDLAQELIDPKQPGDHNQAIMELGAMVCKPKNPSCFECPLNDSCFALQNKSTDKLPVKKQRLQVKKKYMNFFVLDQNQSITKVRQRTNSGIWQNLFEFPSLESIGPGEEFLKQENILSDLLGIQKGYKVQKYNHDPVIHKLTHRTIYATFWLIDTDEKVKDTILWDQLKDYALPVLIQNFVDKYRPLR